MNKKLITLAVAAAMAAPAAALAEATIYGVLHNHIDYVDVEANAIDFGPGTKPGIGVPVNSSQLISNQIGASVSLNGNDFVLVDPSFDDLVAIVDAGGTINGVAAAEPILDPNTGEVIFEPRRTRGFKGWDINGNNPANRIGIKGSEDLGGGLKAIYQVELGVRLADANGRIADGDSGGLSFRNSFVGLAGNFGTFLVGRHDTPLKISTGALDMFADTLADYNYTIGFHDVRANNAIAYISPSFSGFQFAGAVIPSGGATPIGYGDAGESPDGIADAWSVAGIYKNGPFYAGLGYENLGQDHWASTLDEDIVVNGISQTAYLGIPNYGGADDWTKWRVGLGLLDWNGFSLSGVYENHNKVLGAPRKSDMKLWQIQAGYSFGNNTIKAMYGQSDTESCVGGYAAVCSAAISAATQRPVSELDFLNNKDHSSWAVAFDHNFSKRTRAYVLYTATDSDQKKSDWSGFSLGLKHKF